MWPSSGISGTAAEIDLLRTAPPGFEVLPFEGGYATARGDLAAELVRSGLLAEGGIAAHAQVLDSYQGRGSTAIVEIANHRLVVRRFLPGGLLRNFRAATFPSPRRPFAELFLYEHLRRLRFPTIAPVAAVARRVGARFELELITEELGGARDLLDLLQDPTLERARRARILQAAGRTVAHLHRAGIRHADMHLKNLLVREEVVYVIDLDRSSLHPHLSRRARIGNLVRLWRYTLRRAHRRRQRRLCDGDARRFLRGYELDRRERGRIQREVMRRFRRTLPLHRLGWMIESLLR